MKKKTRAPPAARVTLNKAMIQLDAFQRCPKKCPPGPDACPACTSTHRYAVFACNLPWPSKLVAPPQLFASLITENERGLPVPFHFVVMAYHCAVSHFSCIAEPNFPLSAFREEHEEQRAIRERFRDLWLPVKRDYFDGLPAAYDTDDPAAFLRHQELAVLRGVVSLEYANRDAAAAAPVDVSQFMDKLACRSLPEWDGPASPALVACIQEFNAWRDAWLRRSHEDPEDATR